MVLPFTTIKYKYFQQQKKISAFDSVFQEPFGVSIVSTSITEFCKVTT